MVAMRYAEEWSHGRRHAAAARDLVVLARAARAHAANSFNDMLEVASIAGGMREVAIATIETDGWLSAGFPATNALGQGYRVFHRKLGSDDLDVLVTTVTPAGVDVGYRRDTGYEGADDVFLGVVDTLKPRRLRGPALDADVEPYQLEFGEPSVGETGAIARLTMESVYGSELHRVPAPGHPVANAMETDLVMGGNDILGAGRIETTTATVTDDLTVLGGLEVAERLVVGQLLEVAGESTFQGDLEVLGSGTFRDVLVSGSADVRNEITALSMDVSGELSAESVRASSAIRAPLVSATELQATQVVAEDVRADDIQARELRSELVRAVTVEGHTGVYRRIHTGGCTGC